ncbi:MAG: anion permease [Eubacteriales bacterium]
MGWIVVRRRYWRKYWGITEDSNRYGSKVVKLPNPNFVVFYNETAKRVIRRGGETVSLCVDYAVTAFLPIGINAVIVMSPMSNVIANYSSETILLLLGASILTVSWEEVNLDKRIAYTFLALIGSSLTSQVIFWFLLATAMSAVLPNAIV